MDNFNSSEKFNYRPVFAVIFLFVALAIMVLVLWPKLQDLKIIQKQVNEKRNEFETQEDYLFQISEIKSNLDKKQEEVLKINAALPDDPSLASLFNYLQKTSSNSGLVLGKIGSFSTSPFIKESFVVPEGEQTASPSPLTFVQETVFSIEVFGNYSSLKNFLKALEKSARLIRIENTSLIPSEETESFNFSIKMKVYSY